MIIAAFDRATLITLSVLVARICNFLYLEYGVPELGSSAVLL